MFRYNSNNVGEFVEQDYGHTFTYRKTTDSWALQHGLEYEVDVGDDRRYAKISKTRCYMAIDEGSDGKPVIERWNIRRHVVYNQG